MSDASSPAPAPVPAIATDDAAEGEPGPDWTDQVADLVVDTVDKARQKTTGPILTGARVIVYGIVALIVAVAIGVMAVILGGRLLEYLPGPLWVAYTGLGALLVVVGLVLWSRRAAGAPR